MITMVLFEEPNQRVSPCALERQHCSISVSAPRRLLTRTMFTASGEQPEALMAEDMCAAEGPNCICRTCRPSTYHVSSGLDLLRAQQEIPRSPEVWD